MKLLGIALRRPSFGEFTSSAVLGVGLWLALVGVLRASGVDLTRADAACALVVVLWSCVAVRLGIDIARGPRHLVANTAVCGVLLGLLQIGSTLFGA
jgi:hypothetical protein